MKYLYILLIILVLYYLINNLYQNYFSSEHFDPSLVPVSSIVTLAKVAQKLVDGGGTLTNPGNLNIGIDSARGNLTVTGNTTLGFSGSDNKIFGATNINGPLRVNGDISTSDPGGVIRINNNTVNLIPDGGGGLSLLQSDGKTGTRLTTGNTVINGKTTINGDLDPSESSLRIVGPPITGQPALYIPVGRVQVPGATSTPSGSGDMATHFNHSDGNNYSRGNTVFDGGIIAIKTVDVPVYGTGGGQNNKANIKTDAGISIGKLNGGSPMISSDGTMVIQSQSGTTKFLVNSVEIDNGLNVGQNLNMQYTDKK
jgi:hypothetical protein